MKTQAHQIPKISLKNNRTYKTLIKQNKSRDKNIFPSMFTMDNNNEAFNLIYRLQNRKLLIFNYRNLLDINLIIINCIQMENGCINILNI